MTARIEPPGPARRIPVFLALTVLLSALAVILMTASDLARAMMFLLYGWVPAAAAVLTLAATGGTPRDLGLHRPSPGFVLLAFGLGWVAPVATYLPAWLAGLVELDPGDRLELLPLYGTVGLVFGSVLALGEELGWRGLLVPGLASRLSFASTALISGAFWALWHLPVMILFGYHSRAPIWYGTACASLAILLAGFPFAWLRLASRSVWPAAVFHGTHNILFQEVFHPMVRPARLTDYLFGEFGILVLIPVAGMALAAWMLRGRLPETAAAGAGKA